MAKRSTRHALVMSALALLVCVSMLIGTTFAWFTDSVTSTGNIIKSGTLDVTLEYIDDATKDPQLAADSEWKNAADGSIFNYSNWEPGYTQVRHIKIENEGSLALKYKVSIIPKGSTVQDGVDLADVIDVYYIDPAIKLDERSSLPESYKMGTLSKALDNLGTTGYGELEAGDKEIITIALKMQEGAGNEYQNRFFGSEFTVRLIATQLDYEPDSFDELYDEPSEYPITPVYPVTTADELVSRINNATEGEEIFVAAGTFEIPATLSIPSGVSIYGVQANNAAENWVNDPSAEKTVLTYKGTNGGRVIEILQTSGDADEAVSNITINGIMIDCDNVGGKGIYVKKNDGEAIEGVEIVNCAVINSVNDGIDVRNTYGAVIENNYVANVTDSAITLGNYNGYHYETWAEVTAYVCNNVIENVSASENGAITVTEGMGDVVVSGNVIKNVTAKGAVGSSIVKASAITVYDVYEGGEITIEDNTIEDADQGIAIYKYTYGQCYGEGWWEGPTTDNDGVIIRDNSVKNYTSFGIMTTTLNHKNDASKLTTVDIIGNDISATVTDKALVTEFNNSNWKVTASGNTLNGADSNTVNGVFAN